MNKTSVATVSLLAADGLLFLLVGFSSFYELAGFRTEILTGQPYEWPTYHRLTFTISLVCASAVLLCVGLYALHQMRSYGIVISVLNTAP